MEQKQTDPAPATLDREFVLWVLVRNAFIHRECGPVNAFEAIRLVSQCLGFSDEERAAAYAKVGGTTATMTRAAEACEAEEAGK